MKYILFLLFILSAQLANANELEVRRSIRDHVVGLLYSGAYEELDVLAERYRSSEERTSSGLWKLTLLYGGFEKLLSQTDSPEWYWEDFNEKADAYLHQNPNSPTAAIIKAIFLRRYAWHLRGTGWARDVEPENWAPFYDFLNQAAEVLTQSKPYAAIDAEWYTQRAGILNELGVEPPEFEENFIEGLARFPHYPELYFAAMNYYTPRWRGSDEEIEAFANYAVSLTRESQGLGMYARIFWFATQSHYHENNLFRDSSVDWPRMRQGIFDVLEAYPDDWNIQNFAYFACLKGDRETTKALLESINSPPLTEVWKPISLFSGCRSFAGLE